MCQGIQLPFTWPMLWVIRWGLQASGGEIRGDTSPGSWIPAQASLSLCCSLIWIRSYLRKVFSFLSVLVVLKVWPHFGTCSITWELFEMQILQLHPRPQTLWRQGPAICLSKPSRGFCCTLAFENPCRQASKKKTASNSNDVRLLYCSPQLVDSWINSNFFWQQQKVCIRHPLIYTSSWIHASISVGHTLKNGFTSMKDVYTFKHC